MKTVNKHISLKEIKIMTKQKFGNLVKAVVDINRKIMVVDADLHADEEALLIKSGSQQADLWGINFYPEKYNSPDFIEFDSMINLRPSQNNLSRGVEDKKIQKQIRQIVKNVITK